MNLEKIRKTIKIRAPDIRINNDDVFVALFDYTLREINTQCRSKFPELEEGFNIEEGYPHLPEGQENLFIDGIIWVYNKDDENVGDLINQHFGIFMRALNSFREQYIIPDQYQKQEGEWQTKVSDFGTDNFSRHYSGQDSNSLETFFRNADLISAYHKKEIPNSELLALFVPMKYWVWLNKKTYDWNGKLSSSLNTFNLSYSFNGKNYQVYYSCDLLYRGLVLKSHRQYIEKFIFIDGTPSSIFNTVWQTI